MSANDNNAREGQPSPSRVFNFPETISMDSLDRLSVAELEEKLRQAWERVTEADSRVKQPSHPGDACQAAAKAEFDRKMGYYDMIKKECMRRQGETPTQRCSHGQGASSRSRPISVAQPSQTYSNSDAQSRDIWSTIDAQTALRYKAASQAAYLDKQRKMALAASAVRASQPQGQPGRPGNMLPAYSPRETPDRVRAPAIYHPRLTKGPQNTSRAPPAYNNGTFSVVDYSRSSTSRTESLFIDGALRPEPNGVTMSQENAIREEALQGLKKSQNGILRPQFLGPDQPPFYMDYDTTWTEALEEDRKIIKLAVESGLKAHEWQDIPPAKLLAAGFPASRVRKVDEEEMSGQSNETASKSPAVTIAHGSNIAAANRPNISLAQLSAERVPSIAFMISGADTGSTETPATPALSAKAAGKRPMNGPVKNGNQPGSLSGETTPVARPGTPVVTKNPPAIEERETTTVIVAQNVLSRLKADDQHSRYLEHLARQNEARSSAPSTKELTINTKTSTPAGQAEESAAKSETTSTAAQASNSAAPPCPGLSADTESLSESDGFSDIGGQSDADAVVNVDGWVEVDDKSAQ